MASENPQTADRPEPKYKRLWRRYRLRLSIIFAVFFACASVWFVVKMKQAGEQRRAVAALKNARCQVAYDFEFDAYGRKTGRTQPPNSGYMLDILGVDFLYNVTAVSFVGKKCTDKELMHLESLPYVSEIEFIQSSITDRGLASLQSLKHLRKICFWITDFSDGALIYLKDMPQLQEISIEKSRMTDEGIEKLQKELPNLQIDRS